MNLDQGAGEGGWLQISPKWRDKCSRKETTAHLKKKSLNLMENIQRPDCCRGGGCMWVGGCRKDILSSTKGWWRTLRLLNLRGWWTFDGWGEQCFSCSRGLLGMGLGRTYLSEGGSPQPRSWVRVWGRQTHMTYPWGLCPKRLHSGYTGNSPTVYSTSQFVNPWVQWVLWTSQWPWEICWTKLMILILQIMKVKRKAFPPRVEE